MNQSMGERTQSVGVAAEFNRIMKNKELDQMVRSVLIKLGIYPHLFGYDYLILAVKLAVYDSGNVKNITTKLYPIIADMFDVPSACVNRSIRHAVENAANRGKMEYINEMYGIKIFNKNEKPTNTEFISLIADKLAVEINKHSVKKFTVWM